MKLLILTPYIPYPINSGGNQGFFQLVNRLRNHIDITIIFQVKNADLDKTKALEQLWTNVKILVLNTEIELPDSKTTFAYKVLTRLQNSITRKLHRIFLKSNSTDIVRQNSTLTSFGFGMNTLLNDRYINFVHEVINSNNFDLVQVDFFELINIVNILPPNVKKVFIHHEIRYVRASQELNLLKDKRPLDLYIFNYIKNFEIQHLNSYDAVVAMTNIDKQKLHEVLKNNIYIETSPAIVDISSTETSPKFQFNNTLVFLGGSDHFPNLDGIDWFLKNCWNEIQNINPKLQLNIIGNWRSKIIKEYTSKYKNIHFLGFVEDLTKALSNSIMIVPLRIGSGVRIKILDALSNGTPVITTSIGGEGLDLINTEDSITADSESDFIQAVLTLSNNNDLCVKISIKGKNKIISRSCPDDLARIRLNIYKNIIGTSSL